MDKENNMDKKIIWIRKKYGLEKLTYLFTYLINAIKS